MDVLLGALTITRLDRVVWVLVGIERRPRCQPTTGDKPGLVEHPVTAVAALLAPIEPAARPACS